MSEPDWKNFAKSILTDWPTGDLDGSVLFDLSLQYGIIQEVPGGYNSDHHIDAEGICPEEGSPWYEYTFRGEAGPGLYSINDMTARIEELEAKLAKAMNALQSVMDAFDQGREIPRVGVGGMTIEANIKGSIYTGVPAWPVEEARIALAELTGGQKNE